MPQSGRIEMKPGEIEIFSTLKLMHIAGDPTIGKNIKWNHSQTPPGKTSFLEIRKGAEPRLRLLLFREVRSLSIRRIKFACRLLYPVKHK
jgi:hypothetical protein